MDIPEGAVQFIKTGAAKCALVVGAETLSRIVNWNDRGTAILFGDGAGAIVVEPSDEPVGLMASELGNDGSAAEHLCLFDLGGSEPRLTRRGVTFPVQDIAIDNGEMALLERFAGSGGMPHKVWAEKTTNLSQSETPEAPSTSAESNS